MSEMNLMPKIKDVAEKIMLTAYQNGGMIGYESISGFISDNHSDVNRILKQYGKIYTPLLGGRWVSYELNQSGFSFIDSGGFSGIENGVDKQNRINDLTEKFLVLQTKELQYKEKIRSQEGIIRFWRFLNALVGIIGIIGWILFLFIK